MEGTILCLLVTAAMMVNAMAAEKCMWPEDQISQSCGARYSGGVSQKDITLILRLHNDVRRQIAKGKYYSSFKRPTAANMLSMTWDPELAKKAQAWANQCHIGRQDPCRDVNRYQVGQNVADIMSTTDRGNGVSRWQEVITNKWIKGLKGVYASHINPYRYDNTEATTPATQILWANTNRVGCGYSYYKPYGDRYHRTFYTGYYVCNYGPRGNVEGEAVYKIGRTCTKCPRSTRCADGLCVRKTKN